MREGTYIHAHFTSLFLSATHASMHACTHTYHLQKNTFLYTISMYKVTTSSGMIY